MGLTDEQRKAVEQQGRIIVSASAGSGKTTVMIRRLVELIRTGGASVKNVLAVTLPIRRRRRCATKCAGR